MDPECLQPVIRLAGIEWLSSLQKIAGYSQIVNLGTVHKYLKFFLFSYQEKGGEGVEPYVNKKRKENRRGGGVEPPENINFELIELKKSEIVLEKNLKFILKKI